MWHLMACLRCSLQQLPAIRIVIVVLMLTTGSPDASGASDRDQTLVEGLCQRSLFRQAQLLCLDGIDQAADEPDQQADWYKLLFKTYAQQALNSSAKSRDQIWKAAEQQWTRFQQHPVSSLRPDVELQYRLIELAQGELLALAVDLTPDRTAALQAATNHLRSVARALDALAGSIATLQRPTSEQGSLTKRDLQQLHALIEYKSGEALRQQAMCYPVGSPDYIHLLSQAMRRFDSLARLAGDSDLTQRSQLAEVDCHRRLGNLSDAAQGIERLSEAPLDNELRAQLLIQQAELLINRRAARRAIELLNKYVIQADPPAEGPSVAQAELTTIRAYLELAREASKLGNDELVKQWQSLALRLVQQMEQKRSPYWVHLAEREIRAIRPGSSEVADIDVLERAAAGQYRRQLFVEAIETYQRAAELAMKLKDPDRAFDLGFQAAAIAYKQDQFQQARDEFRRLALANPSNIRADQAAPVGHHQCRQAGETIASRIRGVRIATSRTLAALDACPICESSSPVAR